MTAELNFFWAFTHTRKGVIESAGSLDAPVKAVTIGSDGFNDPGSEIVIPASGSIVVYSAEDDGPFDLLVLQIMGGEGFVYITEGHDSPESADDLTASGDHPATTPKMGLSCTAPWVKNTRAVKVNGNATDGLIYTVTVYNSSSTESVRVKRWGRG